MELNDILGRAQFSIPKEEKSPLMLDLLTELHQKHFEDCGIYRDVTNTVFEGRSEFKDLSEIPFLPVSIFKNHIVKSIDDAEVFKVLTSSGTTGQQVSKIYLDRETSQLQTLALSKIINTVLGSTRLPMLIVDSKAVFANKDSFSARGAGILGLSVFGRDHTYILDEHFNLDESMLINFLDKYNGQPIFIFGFTFMVWQYLQQVQLSQKYDLSKAVLIHSGGWKKLKDIAVDNDTFKKALADKFRMQHVYNFYGMIEQIGSVFLENTDGNMQCANFSDVIIRDPKDFSVQPHGTEGLIQVVSLLPKSYPGHSLLTEDIGVITGEDDAGNGWKGKSFRILGRAKKAELRGCSDTFKPA
jgi:phenylacetate-coenzyme A ligase PaaK-like adenylate-forming protein